jgi:hypothetical protein
MVGERGLPEDGLIGLLVSRRARAKPSDRSLLRQPTDNRIIFRFAIPPRLLAIKEFETITLRMTLSKHGMLQDFLPFSPTVPLPLKATF